MKNNTASNNKITPDEEALEDVSLHIWIALLTTKEDLTMSWYGLANIQRLKSEAEVYTTNTTS